MWEMTTIWPINVNKTMSFFSLLTTIFYTNIDEKTILKTELSIVNQNKKSRT